MVVYRAKFAPTIFAARQIVSHGHIYLNGKKTNVASARVKPGDVVELGKRAQDMALVLEAQSLAERDIPEYIAPDGAAKISFVRVPTLDEVPYPVKMEPNLVAEFYRSEEHTSELQSLMRISYAVFCLKKKKKKTHKNSKSKKENKIKRILNTDNTT